MSDPVLEEIVREMRAYALQHPTVVVDMTAVPQVDPGCSQAISINERPIEIVLAYNVMEALPLVSIKFWHLTITPIDMEPMPQQLVDQIVVSFLDASRKLLELPEDLMEEIRKDRPHQRQFSQEV